MTKINTSRDGESTIKGIAFRGITRDLLDELLEGCQVISYEYKYLYLNKAALYQSHMSSDDLIGHTMMECYPGIEKTEMFSILRQSLENRKPKQMENEFAYPDGSKRWYDLRFEPVPEGVFILSIDISDRKETEIQLSNTEAQLRQSQKMEAIGLLAAGLAHDFNNLLTIINISSELILRDMSTSDALYNRIEQILNAGKKASALTGQLLAYSRQQVLELRILNLNSIIEDLQSMIKRLVRENIKFEYKLSTDLDNIKADPRQIEQVLINLIINARDAIKEEGQITIETCNIYLDSNYTDKHFEVQPGNYNLITISDTGSGMSPETKERLFEPFYTTKELGKGSGLGLATVFGIVKQSGGFIWIYSEPDKGSVFKIYFPVYTGNEKSKKAPPKLKSIKGNETILLVEDESEVLEITSLALQTFGYQILPASNGKKALNICKKYKGKIDLMISDVIMQDIGGRELAKKINTLDKNIKVLYMSGYTDDTVVRQGILQKEMHFIQKPFTPDSLAQKVRQVLDQS